MIKEQLFESFKRLEEMGKLFAIPSEVYYVSTANYSPANQNDDFAIHKATVVDFYYGDTLSYLISVPGEEKTREAPAYRLFASVEEALMGIANMPTTDPMTLQSPQEMTLNGHTYRVGDIRYAVTSRVDEFNTGDIVVLQLVGFCNTEEGPSAKWKFIQSNAGKPQIAIETAPLSPFGDNLQGAVDYATRQKFVVPEFPAIGEKIKDGDIEGVVEGYRMYVTDYSHLKVNCYVRTEDGEIKTVQWAKYMKNRKQFD